MLKLRILIARNFKIACFVMLNNSKSGHIDSSSWTSIIIAMWWIKISINGMNSTFNSCQCISIQHKWISFYNELIIIMRCNYFSLAICMVPWYKYFWNSMSSVCRTRKTTVLYASSQNKYSKRIMKIGFWLGLSKGKNERVKTSL